MLLSMGSAWASGQQGSTVRPLRPASVVSVAAPGKALPSALWMLLSVKAKETPAQEFLVKGAFQAWGIQILSAPLV